MITHKHHIIPKHRGGTDDQSNLIEVSIEEHAEIHRKLYEEHGLWQDYVAWQGLLKNIEDAEINKIKQSLGGKLGGMKTKGIPKTVEHRKRMSESRKGKPSNFKGKSHSEETIEKLSKPKSISTVEKMRKPKTPEHSANISKGMKGIIRTPEQKERYRIAALKRWNKTPLEKQKE